MTAQATIRQLSASTLLLPSPVAGSSPVAAALADVYATAETIV
jgi:hypothetical protein